MRPPRSNPFHELLLYVVSTCYWLFLVVVSISFFCFECVVRFFTWPFDLEANWISYITCFWGFLLLKANPLWNLRIEGKEHLPKSGGYIMMSNHQSYLDIFMICSLFRSFRFMAKAVLFNIPILGWGMRINRHIAISRNKTRSRGQALEKTRYWLRHGVPVAIFPEGTRTRDGSILPFRPGAFKMVIEEKSVVVPILINGTGDVQAKFEFKFKGRQDMLIRVLPPISGLNYGPEAAVSFAEDTRDKLVEEMEGVQESWPTPKYSASG